jgi:cytochrome P450
MAGGDSLLLFLLALAVSLMVAAVVWWRPSRQGRHGKSAPSPPCYPLLGHLHHMLRKPLHRSLAALAAAHGTGGGAAPLLSLRLGARRALLVSAYDAAEECQGAALSGRPRLLVAERLAYSCTTVFWASYGDHWRAQRRLLAVQMFSVSRIASLAADRHAEVAKLVGSLLQDDGSMVTLRPRLFEMVVGVALRMLTGEHPRRADVCSLQEISEETIAATGPPSIGDFFPGLRWVDRLRGVDGALARLAARRDAFVGGLIRDQQQRRDAGNAAEKKISVIDGLLSAQEADPEYYTDTIIKGILSTVSSTSNLVSNLLSS